MDLTLTMTTETMTPRRAVRADLPMPDDTLSATIRSTPRFRLAVGSTVLLIVGVLGPWQKSLFGISANGLEVVPALLVPAALLAGYALWEYHIGREHRRKRIVRLLDGAAFLVAAAVVGNAQAVGGLVVAGWGSIVAGFGGAGILVASLWLRYSKSLLR